MELGELSKHLNSFEGDSSGLTRHLLEEHGMRSPCHNPPVDAAGWRLLDDMHFIAHMNDLDEKRGRTAPSTFYVVDL